MTDETTQSPGDESSEELEPTDAPAGVAVEAHEPSAIEAPLPDDALRQRLLLPLLLPVSANRALMPMATLLTPVVLA